MALALLGEGRGSSKPVSTHGQIYFGLLYSFAPIYERMTL
jgi:hypothetical protein